MFIFEFSTTSLKSMQHLIRIWLNLPFHQIEIGNHNFILKNSVFFKLKYFHLFNSIISKLYLQSDV